MLKSSIVASVETLQSAVDDTVSQLEQQGLLTGEALGQIFTSVSDILNTEADQEQKDARTEVTQSRLARARAGRNVELLFQEALLLCVSAQDANVKQNDHSSAELTQQHDSGGGGDGPSGGRTHPACG